MREHTGEKLECDLCDKAFKHKRDLKDHMNIHTGESLYLCDTCPAKFDTKKKLYNHRFAEASNFSHFFYALLNFFLLFYEL